ncbi:MAG TPA: YCF48-related protein [Symbiobacteriaceae bacterium]|jgi:hypothetical protein
MDKRGLVALVLGAALLAGCANSQAGQAGPARGQTPPSPPSAPVSRPAGLDVRLATLIFTDATHGWVGALPQACGNSEATDCQGFLFHTDDSGATWQQAYAGDVAPLALQFSPDGTGWLTGAPASAGQYTSHLVGAQGKLLRTTDDGRSWQPIYSGAGADGAFLSITFTSAMDGWLGTAAGHLLHTVDGGKTWTPGSASCANWVSFVSSQEGFAFCGFPINPGPGLAGKSFLRTTDGGATWQLVESVSQPQQGRKDGLPLGGYGAGFTMRTGTDGWIALTRGGLLHTTDGGNTWRSQLADRAARGLPTVADGDIDYSAAEAVQFLSTAHGYALLSRQYLVETTDGDQLEGTAGRGELAEPRAPCRLTVACTRTPKQGRCQNRWVRPGAAEAPDVMETEKEPTAKGRLAPTSRQTYYMQRNVGSQLPRQQKHPSQRERVKKSAIVSS